MSRRIFIDSTNIDEVKKWNNRGVISGITTNQKIFLTEKTNDFKKTIKHMCSITAFPISVELTQHKNIPDMITEAKKYASWHENIVIKVPMTTDGTGLDVIHQLTKRRIKTNATIMVSFEQLILACIAGASYISLFFNRSKDAGYDPVAIITQMRRFIDEGKYSTQIITGSIRKPRDVGDAFAAGSDIVTITPKVLREMLHEEMTQKTINEFDAAWKEFNNK